VKTDDSEERGPKKPRKRIQKRKKDTGVTQTTQVLGKETQEGSELMPRLEESQVLEGQKKLSTI